MVGSYQPQRRAPGVVVANIFAMIFLRTDMLLHSQNRRSREWPLD
jgi:hypothetical protein